MKTKKQLTNRILSLALTFVLVLGMLPMSSLIAFAADETPTAIYVKETTTSDTEDGSKENPYTTLQAAFDATTSGGNYEIILLSDITVSDAVDYWNSAYKRYDALIYSATANVTLKSDSGNNPYTIYRDCDKWMIRLSGKDTSNKLTFTLRDVVLDGKSENYSSSDTIYSLISVGNTNLYIESGVVLKNNVFTKDNGGGAIGIENSTSSLIMNDGVIEYCKAPSGGGIYSYSPVTINGGSCVIMNQQKTRQTLLKSMLLAAVPSIRAVY